MLQTKPPVFALFLSRTPVRKSQGGENEPMIR
jgi:hypothetical protein